MKERNDLCFHCFNGFAILQLQTSCSPAKPLIVRIAIAKVGNDAVFVFVRHFDKFVECVSPR